MHDNDTSIALHAATSRVQLGDKVRPYILTYRRHNQGYTCALHRMWENAREMWDLQISITYNVERDGVRS